MGFFDIAKSIRKVVVDEAKKNVERSQQRMDSAERKASDIESDRYFFRFTGE